MPTNSLRCEIKKLAVQGIISEEEKEYLLAKLEDHDKELIKGVGEELKETFGSTEDPECCMWTLRGILMEIDDLLKEYGVRIKGMIGKDG